MPDEFGVDAALADPARDQLRVLTAEVDDEDRPLFGNLEVDDPGGLLNGDSSGPPS
jgi:hypothetical protein